MAIDYEAVRDKNNKLNQSAIRIVDMINIVEKGILFSEPLTQAQINGLKLSLKTEADNLKTIAGDIKTLVNV